MKKLLAALLILTMVLPMCVIANAGELEEGEKPFYLLNCEDGFFDKRSNVYEVPIFYTKEITGMTELVVSFYDITEVTPMAGQLKIEFDNRPAGTRYIKFMVPGTVITSTAKDKIYMEDGVRLISQWMEAFLGEYYAIGGVLDGLILNVAYPDGSAQGLSLHEKTDKQIYQKIVDNPLYQTEVRPLLEERGFEFWSNVTSETPEIYSISENSGSQYAQSRAIWDTVMKNRLAAYLNQAVTEPFLKYYPDGYVSNNNSSDVYTWLKGMDNAGKLSAGGNSVATGNTSGVNGNFSSPGTAFFKQNDGLVYKNIPAYNNAVFALTPFNMLLWDTNRFKDMYAAAAEGNISAHLTLAGYDTAETNYSQTPYFAELFYHVGMLDPKPFLGYGFRNGVPDDEEGYEQALAGVNQILAALGSVAGREDRKPIFTPSNWNNSFILSGMYADGRNVWRITPDTTGGMTLEQFRQTEIEDPTFCINGQTVTFPSGRIIENSETENVSSCGYWVETPPDVMPQITYAENRYYQYPAFMETFESYEAGTEYHFGKAYPVTCWEGKQEEGASATIVADQNNPENLLLALKGTYGLKNLNIPENITAGDTYAKNQAWEVAVTVPADMGADGEIVLLDIYTDGAKPEAGGFRIAGGKVYYDKAGKYEELSGVDVAAGGKLLLRREFDFQKADAYTCDYTVCDAAGNLLGEAKDVPMIALKLPVKKIGMSVTNITGEAVLLDDYRLYATGLTTDLEMYDMQTGIKLASDIAANKSVAYRLSWMNATAAEETRCVVAAYYNGDKLISEEVIGEIKMAPNTDAVVTGVVLLDSEGQSVRVYVREKEVSKAPEVKPDTNINTNINMDPANSQEEFPVIIVVAGVMALLAAAGVVVLLILNKKGILFATEEEQDSVEENETAGKEDADKTE